MYGHERLGLGSRDHRPRIMVPRPRRPHAKDRTQQKGPATGEALHRMLERTTGFEPATLSLGS